MYRVRQRQIHRHHQKEGLPEQGAGLDLQVVVQVAVYNGHVCVAPRHGRHRLIDAHRFHPQGYRQPPLQKALIHRRQDILIGGVDGDDVQKLPPLCGGKGLRLCQ